MNFRYRDDVDDLTRKMFEKQFRGITHEFLEGFEGIVWDKRTMNSFIKGKNVAFSQEKRTIHSCQQNVRPQKEKT